MDVSIIIVNYNTGELVVDCIESINKHVFDITYEIIVVDNNSTDDSYSIIQKKNHNIKLIKSNENIGFGRANNIGYKVSKGRNILFLNPDTLLLNNSVKILSDYLDNNISVGACGGNLYNKLGNPSQSYEMYMPGIMNELNHLFLGIFSRLYYGRYNYFFNTGNTPISVGYISGADLMIPRSIIDKVGLFNPTIFMYFEETELEKRIKNNGFKIISIPAAKIIHFEGMSFKSEKINKRKIIYMDISRMMYFKIHHSYIYRLISNIVYLMSIIIYYIKSLGSKYWRMRIRSFLIVYIRKHVNYKSPIILEFIKE